MEFVLNTIFWTLAFYGLYELIKNILYISEYTKFKAKGFLRSSLFKILYGKEEYIKNIIVADLKSDDKTKEIAKKMSEDYEQLKVISWKECKDIIDNLDQP